MYSEKSQKLNIFDKRDYYFAILMALVFSHGTFLDYFAVIVSKITGIPQMKPLFFVFVYFILFILSHKSERFRFVRSTDSLLAFFFVVAFMFSYIVFPENWKYIIEKMGSDILPCVLFFIIGLSLDLDKYTYNVINKVSCIAIAVNIVYVFYFLGSGRNLGGSHGEDYSMYWSYLLLPNVMMTIDYAFNTKRIVPAVLSVAGILYTFAMGTRGPIIVIAVFALVCVWRHLNLNPKSKIAICVISALILYYFVSTSLYLDILLTFKNFLVDVGVSTRVVDYLIDGEIISNTSGRNNIYTVLYNRLNRSPLLGYGVYGEYALGFRAGAHNVYLQVLYNFGYPLGLALMYMYLRTVFKSLKSTNELLIKNWIVLFASYVLIKGIFGGSYLNLNVFFLLGFCLRAIRKKRYVNRMLAYQKEVQSDE